MQCLELCLQYDCAACAGHVKDEPVDLTDGGCDAMGMPALPLPSKAASAPKPLTAPVLIVAQEVRWLVRASADAAATGPQCLIPVGFNVRMSPGPSEVGCLVQIVSNYLSQCLE